MFTGGVIEIMDTQPVSLSNFHVGAEPPRIPSRDFRVGEEIQPEDDSSNPAQDFRVEEDKKPEDDPSRPAQDFRVEEDKKPEDDSSRPAHHFRIEEEEERSEDDYNSCSPKFDDVRLDDSYSGGMPHIVS